MVCSAYALGKLMLSVGLSTEAIRWLKYAADSGDQFARYTLGKVYLQGEHTEKDVDTAVDYLKLSAEQGNQYAQYTLGKLYLLGQEVPPDRDTAVDYLTRSAAQGNRYAQFFLDHLNDIRSPSVGVATLRMLHHMANIFRDSTAQDATHMGFHIDRKRRRELQEKRIAMGHKPDDHEDENMNQNMGEAGTKNGGVSFPPFFYLSYIDRILPCNQILSGINARLRQCELRLQCVILSPKVRVK